MPSTVDEHAKPEASSQAPHKPPRRAPHFLNFSPHLQNRSHQIYLSQHLRGPYEHMHEMHIQKQNNQNKRISNKKNNIHKKNHTLTTSLWVALSTLMPLTWKDDKLRILRIIIDESQFRTNRNEHATELRAEVQDTDLEQGVPYEQHPCLVGCRVVKGATVLTETQRHRAACGGWSRESAASVCAQVCACMWMWKPVWVNASMCAYGYMCQCG